MYKQKHSLLWVCIYISQNESAFPVLDMTFMVAQTTVNASHNSQQDAPLVYLLIKLKSDELLQAFVCLNSFSFFLFNKDIFLTVLSLGFCWKNMEGTSQELLQPCLKLWRRISIWVLNNPSLS